MDRYLARVKRFIALLSLTFAFPALVDCAVPAQSTPIALSEDDTLLASVNPDSKSLSLFNVSTNIPKKLAEISTGLEPSSVALHPNGRFAYVANAGDGTVAVIDLATRKKTRLLKVGVEPVALVVSPNGSRLLVANSSSNNVMVFDTTALVPNLIATIDLSAFGSAPRAVSISNDGDNDDSNETAFVALFFGQLRAGKSALDEGQDDQREGHVVAISLATNAVVGAPNPVVLGPLANAGFNSNGRLAPANGLVPNVASTNPQTFTTPTGAFPNQLAAIALHPTQPLAYVVSTGASPNGPLRFNQMAQGLVSVFNVANRLELTAGQSDATFRRTAPLNLNQGVNLATTPAPRLFLTNPVAMAWRPNGSDAWVVIQNSDLLVRLTIDGTGVPTIGAPLVAGPSAIVRVDLEDISGGGISGKAPRGLAINTTGTRLYVLNYISRSISVVDISNGPAPVIVGTALSSKLPPQNSQAAFLHLGAELFYTGRGPQERMSSESWGGCIVCHPAGRSDNVTWMFETGPRQTIGLDGTFDPKGRRIVPHRILNWSAVRDEVQDFELNTRVIFGGRGLIDDDRLFFTLGGATGVTPTDSTLIEQFQQFTGVAGTTNDLDDGNPLPSLPDGRRDFGVATLDDARVFLIGGRIGAGQGTLVTGANTVLVFNPRTNVLKPLSSAGLTPRHSLGAAAVRTSAGFRIYAIGGYNSTDGGVAPVSTVEEYNPVTNKWRTVSSLPHAVAQFGVTVAGGINTAEPLQLIHVVSGNGSSENTPSVATAAPIQRFAADPGGLGTWTTFNPAGITLRRYLGTATAIRGVTSRVFLIGGIDAAGNVLDTVEEYLAQAVTVVATPHTALPEPRARFGIAFSLSTNQIYVAAGINDSNADTTTLFEYTIAANGPVAGPPGTPSGTWVNRATLSTARRGLQLSTPPSVTNFLPVQSSGRDVRQDAINFFTDRGIRAARAPISFKTAEAVRGRLLFAKTGLTSANVSCVTCHGGPKWTRSAVDYSPPPSPELGLGLGNERVIGAELRQTKTQGPPPAQFPGVLTNVGTFTAAGRVNEIRFNGADISQPIAALGANGINIPSLLSVHESAPYFYSGLAQTLEQVLDGSQDASGGTRVHFIADPQQRADVVAFLLAIDEKTPAFK
ncbi:MAG: hypothetical protein JWL59_3459 [Chthoniobacteraceae bacterium]|nr:hypothetical protein [Chthoniobacteraceae bacterium]